MEATAQSLLLTKLLNLLSVLSPSWDQTPGVLCTVYSENEEMVAPSSPKTFQSDASQTKQHALGPLMGGLLTSFPNLYLLSIDLNYPPCVL